MRSIVGCLHACQLVVTLPWEIRTRTNFARRAGTPGTCYTTCEVSAGIGPGTRFQNRLTGRFHTADNSRVRFSRCCVGRKRTDHSCHVLRDGRLAPKALYSTTPFPCIRTLTTRARLVSNSGGGLREIAARLPPSGDCVRHHISTRSILLATSFRHAVVADLAERTLGPSVASNDARHGLESGVSPLNCLFGRFAGLLGTFLVFGIFHSFDLGRRGHTVFCLGFWVMNSV